MCVKLVNDVYCKRSCVGQQAQPVTGRGEVPSVLQDLGLPCRRILVLARMETLGENSGSVEEDDDEGKLEC